MCRAIRVGIPSLPPGLSDTAVATGDAVAEEAKKPGWFGQYVSFIQGFITTIDTFYRERGIEQSFGLAVITFTLCVKLLLVPLNFIQLSSTEKMQVLQPTIKKINERYVDNKQAAQAVTSRLMASTNTNPLIGCLPALAQIPVFIGLYRAMTGLTTKTDLANQPFLWLPNLEGPTFEQGRGFTWLFQGWHDFTPALGWHDTALYLSLPILLVLSQKLSMSLLSPPVDPTDESAAKTQNILKWLPLMIGYFSLQVPSALGVYWMTNNLSTTATTAGVKAWFKMNPPQLDIPDDILSDELSSFELPTVAEALDDARLNALPSRRNRRIA